MSIHALMVPAGEDKNVKGDDKFFEWNANGVKASDYPHLESKNIGTASEPKMVPVVRVAPSVIMIRSYATLQDAQLYAASKGYDKEKFDAFLLRSLNKIERDETIRESRTLVTDASLLPANTNELFVDVANEVDIYSETVRVGRESLTVKQAKAAELFANAPKTATGEIDHAAVLAEMMKMFGVKAAA